ncbi:MAG: gamma-glutamyl-gamma-aminobutyrate hydrolase family protein, partial [Acidimicrobiia bacterium]
MSHVPRIGISLCSAMTDYVESIRRYGGDPHVLDRSMSAGTALKDVDGLLLTGGGDVNPDRYRAGLHESVHLAEDGRDEFELELIAQARAVDLPVLALCRGIQILNVAGGGTLIQDIPSQVPGALDHRVLEPRFAIAHEV